MNESSPDKFSSSVDAQAQTPRVLSVQGYGRSLSWTGRSQGRRSAEQGGSALLARRTTGEEVLKYAAIEDNEKLTGNTKLQYDPQDSIFDLAGHDAGCGRPDRHGHARRRRHLHRRPVLDLDELVLAALDLLGVLEQPGPDVDDLDLEDEVAVARRERARDHLRDAELLRRLDLREPALLAHEVDLLLREDLHGRRLAEHGVEPVAGEVAHPFRHRAAGVDVHHPHDD